MGRGVMDDRSPLSLSLTMAHRLWPEVDVALAIGSRFQRVQTDWGLDDRVKVIRIDLDAVEITRHARPEVALLADAAEALDALLPQVHADDRPAWRERIAATRAEVQALYRRELAPQLAYLEAIRAALPEDGILVEDLTQIGYVARLAFPVHGPRQYISSGYQGTLGHAFPSALGAKLARLERAVVALTGDGGFMYNVQELATAVQHGINVVALVFNDGAYGNVKRMQRELYGNRVIGSDLTNPDFVRLAGSFGVVAQRVDNPEDLQDALAQALARAAPALIEVKVGAFPDPWRHIALPRVRGRGTPALPARGQGLQVDQNLDLGLGAEQPPDQILGAPARVLRQQLTALLARRHRGEEVVPLHGLEIPPLGVAELLEQRRRVRIQCGKRVADHALESVVELGEELLGAKRRIGDELERPNVGRGLLDGVARDQHDRLAHRVRHAELIEDVRIAPAAIGNHDVRLTDQLDDLLQDRGGEDVVVAPLDRDFGEALSDVGFQHPVEEAELGAERHDDEAVRHRSPRLRTPARAPPPRPAATDPGTV
jgi:hypothetical protein